MAGETIQWNEVQSDVNQKLENLKNRISNDWIQATYEKKENWKFNLKIDWEILNLDIDKDGLVNALKLTYKIISLYIKSWYTREQFYAEESNWSKWQINRASIIDMKIDNRPIFDTNFLSEEGFKDNFLLNPSRSNWIMSEYANFLNKVLAKKLLTK